MATNIQEIVPYDTTVHFDRITDTLNGLIDQLIERRDTLCQVVVHLRDDFHNKESTCVTAIEELDQTQLHLNQNEESEHQPPRSRASRTRVRTGQATAVCSHPTPQPLLLLSHLLPTSDTDRAVRRCSPAESIELLSKATTYPNRWESSPAMACATTTAYQSLTPLGRTFHEVKLL